MLQLDSKLSGVADTLYLKAKTREKPGRMEKLKTRFRVKHKQDMTPPSPHIFNLSDESDHLAKRIGSLMLDDR